jgi:energy-coupling factor transport system substrate-specific component
VLLRKIIHQLFHLEDNMFEKIKKDFTTMTWVLIPVAIAINIAIGQIVVLLKLPVFLDSIGTVLVGIICGPWAGALTGAHYPGGL